MPADTLSRDRIEAATSNLVWSDEGLDRVSVSRTAFNALRAAVEQWRSEPARLAAAKAEGVREGIERAIAHALRVARHHADDCDGDGDEPARLIADDLVSDEFRQAILDDALSPSEPTGGTAEPVHTDDGWIEWEGGECPVAPGTIVETRYRNGNMGIARAARKFDWNHAGGIDGAWDIMFFRIVKPAEPVQTDDGCRCDGCGRRYKVDMQVSDDLWALIQPEDKPAGAGLLCAACIGTRIEDGQFAAYRIVKPAEPSAPVAEGASEATRYLERLIENAAPHPTRPLYGDLIGLCTQVDSLLCYVREQGKERITALEAENARLREGLSKAAAQFEFYRNVHLEKCTGDGRLKAAANERMALMCRALLQGGPDAG